MGKIVYTKYTERMQLTPQEIERIATEGKPREVVVLYLADAITREHLHTPLLDEEITSRLLERMEEPNIFQQYPRLKRGCDIIDREIDGIRALQFNAATKIEELKGLLLVLDTSQMAEEMINTLLLNLNKEEREKQLELLKQTAEIYGATTKKDKDGFLLIDTSHYWREELRGAGDTLSLKSRMAAKRKQIEKAILNYNSALAALRLFIDGMKSTHFALRDIYAVILEEADDEPMWKLPGGRSNKYQISSSREMASRRYGYTPYVEERNLNLFNATDFLSWDLKQTDGRIVGYYMSRYQEDWKRY